MAKAKKTSRMVEGGNTFEINDPAPADKYIVDVNTYEDIEEWATWLISGEDEDWLKPTKFVLDSFENWKTDAFNIEKKSLKAGIDHKLEFERVDKEIYRTFAELNKNSGKEGTNGIIDAYYSLAVLLGKIKYVKSLNINLNETVEGGSVVNRTDQQTDDGIKKFEHYLLPRGLLILPELVKRYNGAKPKDLSLMVLALLNHGLIKPTIMASPKALNKMLSNTFSAKGVPYALSKNFDKYFKNESKLEEFDKDEKESHDKTIDKLISELPTS